MGNICNCNEVSMNTSIDDEEVVLNGLKALQDYQAATKVDGDMSPKRLASPRSDYNEDGRAGDRLSTRYETWADDCFFYYCPEETTISTVPHSSHRDFKSYSLC